MELNIDTIDNKHLFFYITFIIVVLLFFSRFDIKLNIVYGTLIGCIILFYYNNSIEKEKENHTTMINNKIDLIKPTPKNTLKYEEMTNFLFSIQDFYIFNPQAYTLMVSILDIFFDYYEETQLDGSIAGQKYGDMRLCKRDALNALHSLIHTMPSNENITLKLNQSITQLDELLNVYLEKVERTHNLFVHENGYNVSTKLIDKGLFAKNMYDDENNIHYYEFV